MKRPVCVCNTVMKVLYMRIGRKWVRFAWGCPRCKRQLPALIHDFQRRYKKGERQQLERNLAASKDMGTF